MKWRELRGFYFPLCMEETSKAKAKYGALIQQLQKTNSEKDRKAVIEFRKSIEQRIIEIDKFIEENFDQKFVLHFEKCKIKLKKLLQINPKEKLIKQSQNKYFHDVDSLNKLIKKQQEKEKEEKKKKMGMHSLNEMKTKQELNEISIKSRLAELKEKEKILLEKKSEVMRRYLNDKIMPLLAKGILNICETIPDDPVEALANFILDNNYNFSKNVNDSDNSNEQ